MWGYQREHTPWLDRLTRRLAPTLPSPQGPDLPGHVPAEHHLTSPQPPLPTPGRLPDCDSERGLRAGLCEPACVHVCSHLCCVVPACVCTCVSGERVRAPRPVCAHVGWGPRQTHTSSSKQKDPGAAAAGSAGGPATRASRRAGAPPRRLGTGREDGAGGYIPDTHSAFGRRPHEPIGGGGTGRRRFPACSLASPPHTRTPHPQGRGRAPFLTITHWPRTKDLGSLTGRASESCLRKNFFQGSIFFSLLKCNGHFRAPGRKTCPGQELGRGFPGESSRPLAAEPLAAEPGCRHGGGRGSGRPGRGPRSLSL